MPRLLYKYRSLSNFQYFEDIICNNRLFVSNYRDQNDSDEGHYFHREPILPQEVIEQTYQEKNRIKICSLSMVSNGPTLWGHYADGSRGVNMVLEVNDENIVECRNIKYNGLLEYKEYINIPLHRRAIDILSNKLPSWEYEREKRYFTYNNYISVDIKKVILGCRISADNENRVRSLITENNPDIIICKS